VSKVKNSLHDDLFSKYEQIIIYGARGWLGRSSLEALAIEANQKRIGKFLLIGSKTETIIYKGNEIQIYSSKDAEQFTLKNSLFLNFAFLRKERLQWMGKSNFVLQNYEIMEFSKAIILKNSVRTFINISSGAAQLSSTALEADALEPYSTLKYIDELWTKDVCESTQTEFINCRLYSLSGEFINEFENLALSLFIKQAITKKEIVVLSPKTHRTYIDGVDLVRVLLAMALEGNNQEVDSGGILTSLGNLASIIAEKFEGTSVLYSKTNVKSEDYFGDYLKFNKIAFNLKLTLKDLNTQVDQTIKAFKL
jgi:nucleoside-diphosphate-sugar epimerase